MLNLEEFNLATPGLLFSAISLLMLAYTNRFLAYASLVRNLYDKLKQTGDPSYLAQIKNLRHRLSLIRWLQLLGILSLLFCLLSMLFLFLSGRLIGSILFGIALLCLSASLLLLILEIQVSVKALDKHLVDMEGTKKGRNIKE